MRPLNRPMFRYGGPIKEGVMNGMKSKPALVGDPVYPKGPDGRSQYGYGTAAAALFNTARAVLGRGVSQTPGFFKNVMSGIKTPTNFTPATEGIMSKVPLFIQKMLPSSRFRNSGSMIPMGGTGTTKGALVPYGSKVDATGKLGILQALKDPNKLGMAIRENKLLAASTPTLTYNTLTTGGPIVLDTAKGFANFLVPGTRFDPFGPKKEEVPEGDGTGLKRGDKDKNVGDITTTSEKDGSTTVKSDAEKQQILDDRINETKQKYYKLMGIDKMNKDAVYDSLINASQIVQEEGADLKGAIRSGDLQNRIIQAVSKNLDKSADLKKQIDAAILKGEIEKDIKANDPSAAVDLAYKKAATDKIKKDLEGSSAADVLATAEISGKNLVTSNTLTSILSSKGTNVDFTFQDDKYQKWEKNNENKDEIDYLQENYGGLDDGTYVVNKKAFTIKDGTVFEIDLDKITG